MTYFQEHTHIDSNEIIDSYYKFNYILSDFQKIACKYIKNNDNLLVTAHTSAGKTTVAIEAITKTLDENKVAIYISPIKSLSNQKYDEFNKIFNTDIGIITGDIKLNPLGKVLIITAEIFRNSLLTNNNNIYEWNININNIGCVILDEIHFINSIDRGTIFEEIILNLPLNIQIIMLSATISEPQQFAKWIGNLRKKTCHLISTLKRPVPLQHGIWWDDEIHYFLKGEKVWNTGIWNNISNKINKYYTKYPFSLNIFFNCIKYLNNNNMLPAICFLLNRNLCYKYAEKISISLITTEESCEINNIWNNKLHKYKDLYNTCNEWNNLYKLVIKGIAYHHGGMIPILKEIVEILYSKGLIKILLATETFSVGVNFPTKTVIFFNINKFDNKKRLLHSFEYMQMAGRAGRRGKDIIGNVVILPFKNFIDEDSAKKMILSPPQKIDSKFSININFILKHLNNNNIENIYNICYESLLYYQEYNDTKYNILLNKFKDLNVNDTDITIYNKINYITEQLSTYKLNRKQYHKLITEKEDLNKDINFSLVETYVNLKKEIEILELSKNKVNINNQIDKIIEYLNNNNYIDNNLKLTKYGKILSEINECNPFILSYIIFNNYFDKLEFPEIVAICSLLINESNKSQEEIFINDLECSDICKELINNINKEIDIFIKLENELNKKLSYPIWLDWTLNYELFNDVKLWASGNIDDKFSNGNFIKMMLRLNNLLRNIENISISLNNITILNKIYGFQEKIIRDNVISDSLYLY